MKGFHVLVTLVFGVGIVSAIQPGLGKLGDPPSPPDSSVPPVDPPNNPSPNAPPPPSAPPTPSAPPPPSAPSAPVPPSAPSTPQSPSAPTSPSAPSAPTSPSIPSAPPATPQSPHSPSPPNGPNPPNDLPPSQPDNGLILPNESLNNVPQNHPTKSGPTDGPTKKPPPNRYDDDSFDSEDTQSQSEDETESESNSHRQKEHKEHQEHREHHERHATSNAQNVKFILLVSYFRSGSSFVGDLLQQPSQTFYTYEPLKYFAFNHKVDSDDEESALRIVRNILECSLEEEDDYSDWMCDGDKKSAGSSINRNHFLWEESCESKSEICCDVGLIDRVCAQTQTRILKETRMSLRSVEKLLQSLPSSTNFKVIFLARDPRGIYNARSHYRWCKEPSCIEYEQLCRNLASDLEVYPRLVNTYGDRVMIARFEDIALDPFTKGEALYKSLGLPFTSGITNYIDTHTNGEIEPDDRFTFLRNPRELVSKWVEKLNETIVESIQSSCEPVFSQLGYKPVDLSELANADENQLVGLYSSSYSLPNRL